VYLLATGKGFPIHYATVLAVEYLMY